MADAYRAVHPAEQFESLAQQSHAAKLGLGVFLSSEALLFAGLFTLFASYQTHYPEAFRLAIHHNTKILGSINTGVLLTSSALVASAVHLLRRGRRALAAALACGTVVLGLAFLAIKLTEYGIHFHEGIYPGGVGSFFADHPEQGMSAFWTLYYVMTGLHAAHVTVGLGVLVAMIVGVLRGAVAPPRSYPLDLAAMYWHLVDVVWIFLWPLFYLA
jgi:cytochrome c oxidase subunit 3